MNLSYNELVERIRSQITEVTPAALDERLDDFKAAAAAIIERTEGIRNIEFWQ